MIGALLTAVAMALAVGALGALAVWGLSRRSLTLAALASPLVAVLAMAAGVLTGARVMLFDADRTNQLTVLVAAVLVVSLLTGAVTAWQLARRERIQAAERARRVTLSHLSHDLRTPLARIRAMSEALADGVGSARESYPPAILEEIDRAITMADDMLVITTLEARSADDGPAPESVDLRDLVSDTVSASAALAASRGVVLEGRADGDLVVTGRARELSRALGNLVGNALHHTPEGGTVLVHAVAGPGRRVRLGVRDQCGGIDAATRERMFEAFWRADEARTPSRPGAGLGLTIVRAVAESHGGRAEVLDAPGGCEAVIELPR